MGLIPARVPGGIALNSAHLRNAFPSTSSTYKKKSVWPHKAKQKRFPGIQLIFEAREVISPITVYLPEG